MARAEHVKIPMKAGATWRDYLELCKPRVVLLMVLTTMVGMCLATPGLIPWRIFVFGNVGIAMAACSAASLNHLADRHIDRVMRRTMRRPMVQGKIAPLQTALFATVLGVIAMTLLVVFVNELTAVLTFASLIVYAFVYTLYLKHATPQNIVIGGIAGATPPLLGWVAVTGHIDPPALLLLLIIFVWTPPHFWALAIHRIEDYAKAEVPMLPVVYGIPFTKRRIWQYTLLLAFVAMMPCMIGMSGWLYGVGAAVLNLRFLQLAWRLKASDNPRVPMRVFKYSIVYLMLIFVALVLDHYVLSLL